LVDRERWVAGLILAESRPGRTRSRLMVDRIERRLAGLDRLEGPGPTPPWIPFASVRTTR